MPESTGHVEGSGKRQSDLWTERARDWADVMEGWSGWGIPVYLDVVTGFNSFFIAADMVNALREARRVARPGAGVAMTVFGRPERCQSTTVFSSLRQFMPPRAGSAADDGEGPGLHEEGTLETRATDAGLSPKEAGYLEFAEEYPNLETMVRGYLAAPPFVRAARAADKEAVREALVEALRPLETASGRYRLEDEVRYLIAVA